MNGNTNKAFSLIELSIVVLVIGILIAGVTQGSKLYDKFKLQTAQALTRSSPVNSVKNLVVWYETTLDSSFDINGNVDNTRITTWRDINPQKPIKILTTNASPTCSTCPTFIEKGINNLPTLSFDGSRTTRLQFDGSDFANSDYTIFIVEQRGSDSFNAAFGWPYLLSSSNFSGLNSCIEFGYPSSGTTVNYSQCGSANSITFTSNLYSGATPIAHTLSLSQNSGGRRYWLNGGTNPAVQDATKNSRISQLALVTIGGLSGGGGFYSGNISEIIIFNRALINEERIAIEKYLGQKYAILINS